MTAAATALDVMMAAVDELYDAARVGVRSAKTLTSASWALYKAMWRLRGISLDELFGDVGEGVGADVGEGDST